MCYDAKLALLAILTLTSSLGALSLPNFSSVEKSNNALAPSLAPFPEASYSGSRATTAVSGPVEFFAIEIFAAMPSVDGRISSSHPPKILWGWSESHAPSLEQTTFGKEECSSTTTRIAPAGNPYPESFSATAEFEGRNSPIDLRNGSLNPFETGFSKDDFESPLAKDNATDKSLPQLLKINISGTLLFPYLATVEREYKEFIQVCSGPSGESCRTTWLCTRKSSSSTVIFRKSASAGAEFIVENGNITFFLLQPILREQLADRSSLQAVIFSKRLPAQISFENFSPSELYNFSISQDALGVMRINSSRLPSPANFSEKELFISPKQLQNSSEAFSHAYAANSSFPNAGGRQKIRLLFTDHFGDAYAREYEVKTRKPSFLHFENSSSAVLTDENGTVLTGTLSRDSLGAVFKGDDFYRPSAEPQPRQTSIDFLQNIRQLLNNLFPK